MTTGQLMDQKSTLQASLTCEIRACRKLLNVAWLLYFTIVTIAFTPKRAVLCFKLQFIQLFIQRTFAHELFMRAYLGDSSLVQHNNAVSLFDG